jgi:hypothetical protein
MEEFLFLISNKHSSAFAAVMHQVRLWVAVIYVD